MKKQVLDYIARDIQTQCSRLCINAQFSSEIIPNRYGGEVCKIESTDFTMVPMIFKSIHIEGRVWVHLVEIENPKNTKVSVRLTCWFETFDGGTNGTDLGTTEYAFTNEDVETFELSERNLKWIVRKVHGIEL